MPPLDFTFRFFQQPKLGGLLSHSMVRKATYLVVLGISRLRTRFESKRALSRPTSSLQRLDRILQDASSLHSFFEDSEFVERYYCEMRLYFGAEKFPRHAFDRIVNQLKIICNACPSFGEDFFRATKAQKHFEMTSLGESAGRSIDRMLWRVYWRGYNAKLRDRAFAQSDVLTVGLKTQILSEIRNYAKLVAEHEVAVKSLSASRKKRTLHRKEFFQLHTARESLQRAAATLVALFFSLPENRQLLFLSDADLILYFLSDLRQNPRKILSIIPDCPIPPGLLSLVRSMLPDVGNLKANLDLFPYRFVRNRNGIKVPAGRSPVATIQTTLLHPVHTFWLGIPGNDCLGGDSDMLTPARWLVSALEGSMAWVIECEGEYQGFVRCTPVETADGKRYGSLEIWAPIMIRSLLIANDLGSKRVVLEQFFEAWFPRFVAALPPVFDGMILSDSVLIDNMGIKNVLATSHFFRNGKVIGRASGFRMVDPLAKFIADIFATEEVTSRYGSGVIFDALIKDAGAIRLLSMSSARRKFAMNEPRIDQCVL